jgi:hypothetical protein
MNLPADKQKRLADLLGMLGSAHDGEVLNAAKLAQRELGKLALTWGEVLGGGYSEDFVREVAERAYAEGFVAGQAAAPRPKAAPAAPRINPFVGYASHMLDEYAHCLSEWEIGFCESWTLRKGKPPSEKERAIFARLARKTGVELPEPDDW